MASAAPALTVQTAALTESGFSVWMQSAKSYKVGQTSAVQVVLVPKGEFHCNEKYPYKVKLGSPPAGISYPQEIVRDASVSATRTSITVPFTPTAAGDARITGIMIESHLKEGRQDIAPGTPLQHGVSVTDACISMEQTIPVLQQLASAVRTRRGL